MQAENRASGRAFYGADIQASGRVLCEAEDWASSRAGLFCGAENRDFTKYKKSGQGLPKFFQNLRPNFFSILPYLFFQGVLFLNMKIEPWAGILNHENPASGRSGLF